MPMHGDAQLKIEINRIMSVGWLSFPEMYTSLYAAIRILSCNTYTELLS